ncbi:MAG: DUF2385 domain-containing protein [Alphaproteobacteria bacterium]
MRPVSASRPKARLVRPLNEMIRLERPTSDQKVGMINRFNAGYASGQRFTVCTDAARAFAASTAREGEAISRARCRRRELNASCTK